MESAVSNVINVTEKALKKLVEIKGDQQKMLRVAVMGGGCSGMQYKLSWDDMSDKDHMMNFDAITVIVDPKSALFIRGIELDYSDGLDGTGFVFRNPNATRSCGCGSSFSCS